MPLCVSRNSNKLYRSWAFMEQSPWESNSLQASQEISRFLWNTNLAAIFTKDGF